MDNEIKNSNLPKIIFGFDKEWELENWYDSCIKKISYNISDNNVWNLGSIPQEVKNVINNGISEKKKYYAYFTFGRRCPFCDNKFMFSQFVSFVTHASHEIMHIEFLKKYHKYCLSKGLTETQVQHLKEILTVILNEDMKDFLSVPDRGYDSHKKIREEVLKMYKEHKKTKQIFTVFLDNSINFVFL